MPPEQTTSQTPDPQPVHNPVIAQKYADALAKYATSPGPAAPSQPAPVTPAAPAQPEPEPAPATPPPQAPTPPPPKAPVLFDEDLPIAPKVEPEQPKPIAEPKFTAKGDDKPTKVDQLREAYDKLKDDFSKAVTAHDVTKKDLETFQRKSQQYEDRIKALEVAESHAKELEKQVQTYDEQLRTRAYTEHPEFHEKYIKPVSDAIERGRRMAREMIVDSNGEHPREGTSADFDMVLRAPNLTKAAQVARELFGDELYQTVLSQRQRVLEAEESYQGAVKQASVKAQEWAQQQARQQEESIAKRREAFQRERTELGTKYAAVYMPDDKDSEAVEVYRRGIKQADEAIHGNPDATPEQLAATLAKAHHRLASFPLQLLKIQRLQTENDTLRSKLAAYEKSEPEAKGRTASGGTVEPAQSKDMHTRLRAGIEAYSKKPAGR